MQNRLGSAPRCVVTFAAWFSQRRHAGTFWPAPSWARPCSVQGAGGRRVAHSGWATALFNYGGINDIEAVHMAPRGTCRRRLHRGLREQQHLDKHNAEHSSDDRPGDRHLSVDSRTGQAGRVDLQVRRPEVVGDPAERQGQTRKDVRKGRVEWHRERAASGGPGSVHSTRGRLAHSRRRGQGTGSLRLQGQHNRRQVAARSQRAALSEGAAVIPLRPPPPPPPPRPLHTATRSRAPGSLIRTA